jgi:hypothetical protein
MSFTEPFRKLANLLFPYFVYPTVTQPFVWRHGLWMQLGLARTARNGKLGHYYEFGVFRLNSIRKFNSVRKLAAWKCKEFNGIRIFAFDSFQGLPEATADDVKDKDWRAGAFLGTLDDVSRIAARNRIRNIRFIEGFYEKSLTPELAEELATFPPSLVHVDCDLYSSTVVVLRWLDKLALPGALYFFDDIWKYQGHPQAGELRAIAEYNANTSNRGMLIEDPLSLGSKMVYRFCPREPEEGLSAG